MQPTLKLAMISLLMAGAAGAADQPIPLHELAIGVTPLREPGSILPPGMRSIDVTMTKQRPRAVSHRAFVRRLLSHRGPKGRLE